MKNQQLRRHLKNTLGTKVRYFLNKRRLGQCGLGVYFDKNTEIQRYPKNVFVQSNVVIKEGARICACNANATISIGKNTTIGFHTFIYASEQISIGDDCLIAPFVYFVDSDHEIVRNKKINEQPNQTSPIKIGNDVWIGTGVKILKGVTIGNGAVIASGALVKNNVKPYEIVGGIPAKHLGFRE